MVPGPRVGAGLALDEKDGYLLMFGGAYFGYPGCTLPAGFVQPHGYNVAVTDETWMWDGSAWKRLHPLSSPPPRTVWVMAYDPHSERVILFGGGAPNADPSTNDMWSWDGYTWTQLHPATLPPWCGTRPPAVLDRDLSAVLLLACNPTGQPDFGHFWEWTGTDWTYQAAAGTPPPMRFDFGFAYDPVNHNDVLVGGATSLGPGASLHDTWLLTAGRWSRAAALGPPGPTGAAYDVGRHQFLWMAGPESAPRDWSNETWTWDGTGWTLHHPVHRPPGALADQVMAYDPISRQVIVFGGKSDELGSAIINETWAWNGSDWVRFA